MEDIENLKSQEGSWEHDVYKGIRRTFPDLKGNKFLGIPMHRDLSGKPVYVSIDLDVLQYFPTAWRGHGRLDEEMLNRIITRIGKRYKIVAGDICGVDSRYLNGSEALNIFLNVYKSLKCAMNPSFKRVPIIKIYSTEE